MEFTKGILLLHKEDCDYITRKREKNNLYEIFEKFVRKNNSKIEIKRVNAIQAGGNNFKLSLELMQCIRDKHNK